MLIAESVQTAIDRFVENRISPLRDALTNVKDRLTTLEQFQKRLEPEKPVPGPKYKVPCRISSQGTGKEFEIVRSEKTERNGFCYYSVDNTPFYEPHVARVVREGPPPPDECTCDARKREEADRMIVLNSSGDCMRCFFSDALHASWGYYKECIHCNLPIKRSLLEEEP